MNRAEKRQKQRLEDKNKLWFDNLPKDKKLFVNNYIDRLLNLGNNLFIDIFDKCVICALYDNFDLSMERLREITSEIDKYSSDYKEFLEKEGEGGYKMIENTELREEIKTRIRNYITSRVKKAEALKIMRNEFNIPFAELSDLWMECKSDKVKKTESVIPNEHTEKHEMHKREKKSDDDSGLKIINVFKEIQGRYGVYLKSEDGVKFGDKHYENIDVVKEESTKEIDKYDQLIESTRKQLMLLTDKIEDAEYNRNIEKSKYEELIKVLEMDI